VASGTAGDPVTVRAWVADHPGAELRLEELTLDEVRPDEVLVSVAAAGICHTDILYTDGSRPSPFPVVVGHEGAGVVAAVGPGISEYAPGDRVVMSFSSCGDCPGCRRGRPSYCAQFRELNSGFGGRPGGAPRLARPSGARVSIGFFGQSCFADHAVTRARNLVRLTQAEPFRLAAPFGCAVQTGAGTVLNTLRVGVGDSLLVVGTGAVGMSAVMAARTAGASPIVAVDPVVQRRELSLALGATHTLDPAEVAGGALMEIGGGLDYAIDTSGRSEMIRAAVAGVHSTGVVVLLASGPPEATVDVPLRDLVVGRQVCGAVEGDAVPQEFIPRLLALWRQGRFPIEALVTTFPETEINEAMRAMRLGRAVKPVVVFGDVGGSPGRDAADPL
jgi:aryl-alcohol dehydrogenase